MAETDVLADLLGPIPETGEQDDPLADLLGPVEAVSEDPQPEPDQGTISPIFPSSMYDEYTPEEADQIYQQIIQGPNVQQHGTNYHYVDPDTGRREVIPKPQTAWFGIPGMLGYEDKATVRPMQTLAHGTRETIGDAVVLGSALVDKAFGTNFTPGMEAQVPHYNTSMDTVDALIADAGPAAVSGVGVGGATFKALTRSPALFRGVISAVFGETAATAGAGEDEGTLFIGETATFPFLQGVADLGDEAADQVIEHRLNTFAEGLALSGVVTGAAFGVKGVGRLVSDYLIGGYRTIAGGTPAIERQVYLDLSSELANLGPKSTEADLMAARQRIADIIKENKSVFIQTLDGIEASEVGIDTVSALLQGLDDPAARGNAMGIRRGATQTPAGSAIQLGMDAPARRMEEGLAAQRTGIVGDNPAGEYGVLSQGADTLVEGQRRAVGATQAEVAAAQAEYDEAVPRLFDDIANDVEFGEDITRLSTVTGTRIPDIQTARLDEIQSTLRNSYEAMTVEKNALYAEVKGGAVDTEALVDKVLSLRPGQLEAAYNSFPGGNTQIDTFFSAFRRARAEAAEMAANGEIPEDLIDAEARRLAAEAIDGMGLDFGVLYSEIRPVVSYVASSLFDSQNPADKAAGRVMRDFVSYIDNDALEFVRASNPELAEAADAAKAYYSNEFAPIWRSQGRMEEYANIYDSTIGRTKSSDMVSRVTGSEISRAGYNEQVENLTSGILSGSNRFAVSNLTDALAKTGNPEAVADYMILDVINTFATDVRASGLQGADFSGMSQRLQQYAASLRQNPALAGKADSIDRIITQIEAARNNQGKLEEMLTGIQDRSKDTLQEIQNNVVTRFFTNTEISPAVKDLVNPTELITTSNPYGAFSRVFSGNEARANIDALMVEIGKASEVEQPILMDALKLSYNKYLDDISFGRTTNTSGVRTVSVSNIAKALENLKPAFDVGRRIYGELDPETGLYKSDLIDGLETSMRSIADMTQEIRATPIRSESATGFNAAAATATNRIIYATVGPLTRAGTRIRSISGAIITKVGPDQVAQKVFQNLLSDPQYYLELAAKYNRNPSDPLLEDLLIRYTTSGIIKADMDYQEADPSEYLPDTVNDVIDYVSPPRFE